MEAAMGTYEHEGLRVEIDERVAFVTLDHPPVNLFDAVLIGSLGNLAGELADDDEVGAVVVRSADPEFFIAHADLGLIQALPRDRTDRPEQLEFIHVFMERWRTLPQVTIAQLEGRARGGGSEFALSLDLRFGAIGRAILGQPEVAVGILPGGSGTQRLPRLMGRSRALEVVLGCEDFDAELAERYGWINRALPAAEIGPFVERLARRIAAFPPHAVRLAKRAVDAAGGSLEDGLLEESHCFNLTLADPQLDARMEGALAAGAQTREGEMDLPGLIEASLRPGSAR
jgi:enoyl-CoA hydratase/carnithine racemase